MYLSSVLKFLSIKFSNNNKTHFCGYRGLNWVVFTFNNLQIGIMITFYLFTNAWFVYIYKLRKLQALD